MVGSAKLSYEELETILIEIEGVLNSRPLTYVYDEITDQPITSSCLVIGRRLMSQPESCKPANEGNKLGTLSKRASYFRGRWKKEYLIGIREHQRLKTRIPVRGILSGDIVDIHQDKSPRLQWRLGRVTILFPGRDGIIRSTEVTTLNPSNQVIRVNRRLEKLYLLEVRSEEEIERKKLNQVQIKTDRGR